VLTPLGSVAAMLMVVKLLHPVVNLLIVFWIWLVFVLMLLVLTLIWLDTMACEMPKPAAAKAPTAKAVLAVSYMYESQRLHTRRFFFLIYWAKIHINLS
jgi:hypothetical protein